MSIKIFSLKEYFSGEEKMFKKFSVMLKICWKNSSKSNDEIFLLFAESFHSLHFIKDLLLIEL